MTATHPHSAPDQTGPAHRYNAQLAGEIETRWQKVWDEQQTFRTLNPGDAGFDDSRPKFYCLDMFPYPSGAGLHVGHPEGYTATDIICRYRRMIGQNVLHPMGWDAFGLPAEQYAIQTGVHPAETTRNAIENFRRQLKRFGFSYDWSREFGTIDAEYYRWTQWIFLKIYDSWFDTRIGRARPISELVAELESGAIPATFNPNASEYSGAGDVTGPVASEWSGLDDETRRAIIDSYRLAYIAEQTVNWCPQLGTALANEEVIDGRSERGSFPVHRKPLRQWMFRITAYADRLLQGLEDVEWPESTRTMQREWIGRSEGAEIQFALENPPAGSPGHLRVFTTRPDTVFGATFMVIAPEHPLVDEVIEGLWGGSEASEFEAYVTKARNTSDVERQESKAKTGVDTGVRAINPATGETIPVFVADYVLMGYGHGAIMAVPGQDQRDWDFAKAFDLPIVRTVEPTEGFDGEAFTGDGPAINSGFLDGMGVADAKRATIEWLEKEGIGQSKVTFKLRDWLFSRQRYWGEPIPIVFDRHGQHFPVSEESLPVRLPDVTDYKPEVSDDPMPLLAKAKDWLSTTAGAAGAMGLPADATVTREANTMPGWAGSCWYYLRYCDAGNQGRFVGREAEKYWMDGCVDLYVGGAEHAVLHLLYARFWHKVLFDRGEVSTDEPFRKLFHQGLITSFAYQRADKTLVPVDEVEERDDGTFVERATGEKVEQTTAKMSKSLKNVINPDDVIAEFGADTFRLYEMYLGPLDASKPWNPRDIGGLYRFLQRLWRLAVDEETGDIRIAPEPNADIEKLLHRTTEKVAHDIDRLAFNTAIAALIELVNAGSKLDQASPAPVMTDAQLDRLARLLSPFAPHMAEELWCKLGREGLVCEASWPEVDAAMLVDDSIEIPVQLMGKVKAKITVPADISKDDLEAAALGDEKVKALLEGKTVRKVVVVPGRLVNIVAN